MQNLMRQNNILKLFKHVTNINITKRKRRINVTIIKNRSCTIVLLMMIDGWKSSVGPDSRGVVMGSRNVEIAVGIERYR